MTKAEAVASALGVVLPQPMETHFAITLAGGEQRISMCETPPTRGPTARDRRAGLSIAEMRGLVGLTTPTIDMVLDLVCLRHPR